MASESLFEGNSRLLIPSRPVSLVCGPGLYNPAWLTTQVVRGKLQVFSWSGLCNGQN